MNSYELSRTWFDFAFENPEKISPNHAAIYFFAIEHCNRLGWRDKFGFPTQMAMDAVGIKKHGTYMRYFRDLEAWGFFDVKARSQNQWSANIISLQNTLPKTGRALDRAMRIHNAKCYAEISQSTRQSNGESTGQSNGESTGQSTGQSNGSIDKLLNHITLKPDNLITQKEKTPVDFLKIGLAKDNAHMAIRAIHTKMDDTAYFKMLDAFYVEQIGCAKIWQNSNETQAHFVRWAKLQPAPVLNGRDINTIPTDKEILI